MTDQRRTRHTLFDDTFRTIERLKTVDESELSQRSKGVIIEETGNIIKGIAYNRNNVLKEVADIMGGKPHKLKWLEKYDGDMAASHAQGLSEGLSEGLSQGLSQGRDLRDQEKITDMLRRGKTVEEIVDFCGYPYDQVKKVEDSLLATTAK